MTPRRTPLILLFAAVLLTAALAEDEPDLFADEAIFPPGPAPSLRNYQKLLPAAETWTDLAVFTALVAQLTKLDALPPLPTDGTPFAVFAPTNDAFLRFLAPGPDPAVYADTAFLSSTLRRLLAATEDDATPPEILNALAGTLRYHVVAGPAARSEPALRAAGSVATLRDGSSLDTSAFPKVTDARNGTSTRYGRSLRVGDNGLLVTVDRVLEPVDPTPLRAFLFGDDLPEVSEDEPPIPGIPPTFQRFASPTYIIGDPPQEPPLPDAPYTYALASYAGLLSARADLQIFAALAAATPALRDALLGLSGDAHLLLPTDGAFLALLRATGLPAYRRLATLYTRDRFNAQLRGEVVRLLEAVLSALPGAPSVADVASYHVLRGPAPLGDRSGAQDTLVDGAALSVGRIGSQFFVVDGDASRGDPRVIVSLPTSSGFASVIDGVLLNINLGDALAGLDDAALAKLPRPELPEPATVAATPAPAAPAAGAGPAPGPVVPAATEEAEPSTSPDADGAGTGDGDTAGGGTGDGDGDGDGESGDDEDDDGVCFPADARVHTADGSLVAMENLQPGDHVQTHPSDKEGSRVFLFSHRTPAKLTDMVRLETASGHAVRATPGHYIFVGGKLRAFSAVRVGDVVHTVSGDSVVTRVSRAPAQRGLYAPHALRANLVVDGVWVSGYSRAVRPRVAEALLAPLRFVAGAFGVVEPIGGALYDGAGRVLRFIPRGADAY